MGTNVAAFPHLGQRWWMLLLRGIFAILFGILAFMLPGLTVLILTTVFAVYAFFDGIIALIIGVQTRWWILSVLGVIGILAGIVAFFFPGITALSLLFLIAAWAIARGAAEIATAIQLRKVIPNEWWLILGGIVSVLFGVLLFANPTAGAIGVIWVIGTYAFIFGILLIMAAFRIKSHPDWV